jgi:FkbM family methyltransferase
MHSLQSRIADVADRWAIAPRNRLQPKIGWRVRRLLVRTTDPLVTRTIGGRPLVLPLSHDLPLILAQNPHYAGNLLRLATEVGGSVVDIGANVGDTVALLRSVTAQPILAVEGDPVYFPLLVRNVEGLRDVTLHCAYVAVGSDVRLSALRERGTAGLVPTADTTSSAQMVPLREILASNAGFPNPGLLKMDTDGHDAAILEANVDLLRRLRPVTFFEYDPVITARTGDLDGERAFRALREAGYDRAIVWANTGELMGTLSTRDPTTYTDLSIYASTPSRYHFFDIAAFPDESGELYERVLAAERDYFRATATAP